MGSLSFLSVSSALLFFLFSWMPGTIISFWGFPIFSEGVYLFGSFLFYFLFSLFLSLSLLFSLLYRWIFYASASETNRVGFIEFLLQNKGKGRFVQWVGVWD